MESLEVLNHGFKDLMDKGDPRVKDWPLMQSPFPGIAMIVAYIYFVKVAGPQSMEKRKPYDLRVPMVVYNFAMVLVNFYIFMGIGWYSYFNGYSLKCQPVDYSNNHDAVRLVQIGYLYYLSKFVEFADTIFFVLRKKYNQISALHVIHHSIVPFSLWWGIKFAPGGYNVMFPFLNSLVHVIMYSYYGVAALGEKYKKFLFWKKYMTYIQLAQFVAVIIYSISLWYNKCDVSPTFLVMNFIHALLFLGLFLNFFIESYMKPAQKKSPVLVCDHASKQRLDNEREPQITEKGHVTQLKEACRHSDQLNASTSDTCCHTNCESSQCVKRRGREDVPQSYPKLNGLSVPETWKRGKPSKGL